MIKLAACFNVLSAEADAGSMEKVKDQHLTELEQFWQNLVPMVHGEKICLHKHGKYENPSMTYKDFYAHAHCAAAYLMNQGLQHGDSVVILSENTADYLILDLALQYLGAINITLPSDIDPEKLLRVCDNYEAKFLFVPDAETLRKHDEFRSIKSQLTAILVGTDDLEGLDTQKLIAFDRLVAIGKTVWRERVPLLRERMAMVKMSDLYALIYPDNGAVGDFEPLSFMSLIENIHDAEALYKPFADGACISFLPPYRVLHRTHGTYGAMKAKIPFWIYPFELLKGAFFESVRPNVLQLNPADFHSLYTRLPQYMGKDPGTVKAAETAIAKAHEVLSIKMTAESQGKKNPFFNRIRYKTSNKKTYAKVRQALGGRLTHLICDQGELDREAFLFFTECGIKIEQPKPIL